MSNTCACCKQDKFQTFKRASQIVPGVRFDICASCRDKNYEPRHLIILAARSRGAAFVAEYINKHRYCGEELTAKEVTT